MQLKQLLKTLIVITIFAFMNCAGNKPETGQNLEEVSVNYRMAEEAIQWLEYILTQPGMENIRKHFMKKVAPTKGCRSIIHHWERFREWNEKMFLDFILEALDIIPSDKDLKNEDGTLTSFGMRRKLWMYALNHTEALRKDLNRLKKAEVKDNALKLAREYLPEDADISNRFYVVLFGASSAYSVGDDNGFDLLQLPNTLSGEIYVKNVIETFAHEMHHSGFQNSTDKNMEEVIDKGKILLAGILAAEGMPTHFINRVRENLELLQTSDSKTHRMLAEQWKKNLARLPELYRMAEKDIRKNMNGEIGQKEIFETWLTGLQGPVYVLGSDMFAVVEKHLGLEEAKKAAQDYRLFLSIYNRAAEKARSLGREAFIFEESLAEQLKNFTGAAASSNH